tara:strand:- start:15805 stop:17016 length:1212 start_codon:yes stop_codon:yes gene_type:complete
MEKYSKLLNRLACPKCHEYISFSNAVSINSQPFFAGLACKKCGTVGSLSNGRAIFTAGSPVNLPDREENLSGAISRKVLQIESGMRNPEIAWTSTGHTTWSETANSRFEFNTSAIGVAVHFLKHPWSGKVRVYLNDQLNAEIDLLEEAGSMQLWHPIFVGLKPSKISIEVLGQANEKSKGTQVHLVSYEELSVASHETPSYTYEHCNFGNPYPQKFMDMLSSASPDALVLDCGSGDRNYPDPRVIGLEYSMFQAPDLFGDGHQLPFKDNSFDLILSQAVVEHLHDPFTGAREIIRVLKPGGTVYVESAFMQPLHAVPFHFFNTTGWGLERLFSDLDIQEVTHEGQLRDTLNWFYNLTALRTKGFADKVDELLSIAGELDSHITAEELRYFSSFVTLTGLKSVA